MPHLRSVAAAAAAVAALAVAPAVASANATVSQFGTVVTVASAADEANKIAIRADGGAIVVTESGAPGLTASVGCSNDSPKVVRCQPRLGAFTGIEVDLGPGQDELGPGAALDVALPVTADGGPGDDTLMGGGGGDTLNGAGGDDKLDGKGANDTLNGGAGVDTLFGDAGDDTLNGGDANDLLRGGEGTDTLNGDAGDDELRGDAGNDRMDGRDGADTASYAGAAAAATVVLGPGGAETAGNGRLGGEGAENDTIVAVENVLGGRGADQLTGNELANALTGGEGGDRLDGREGTDAYLGGRDNDVIIARDGIAEPAIDCQDGTDELVGDNGADGTAGCEAVAPQLVSPPSLSGEPTEGLTLTVTAPGASGSPLNTAYEWHRCTADGASCTRVPNAAATTYRLTQFDVGKTVFARVIVSNPAGRVSADTGRTAPVANVPGTPGIKPPGRGPNATPTIPRGPAAEITALASKPKLSLRGKRLRLATGRRIACRAAVRTCGVEAVATAKLKPKKKKGRRARRAKKTELGTASYVVKAGQTVDVVVKLSKKARKKLRAGRRVTITLKITVVQSGSDDVTERVKLKVKVPRAKKRR